MPVNFIVMTIGENKYEDLQVLENYVKHPHITEYTTQMRFNALRNRYPYEFILYVKQHRKSSDSYKVLLDIAIKRVNKLYQAMTCYIINPPETEEQKDEFDEILHVLKKLLHRQNVEN